MSFQRISCVAASLLALTVLVSAVETASATERSSGNVSYKKKSKSKGPSTKSKNAAADLSAVKGELDKAHKAEGILKGDLQAQKNRHEAGTEAAESLKKDVDSQKDEVDKLHADNKPIYDAAKEAKAKLDKLAEELEQDEPSSSPVAKAHAAYDAARQRDQAEKERILNSEEYQTALTQAQDSGDKVKIADVKDEFLQKDIRASEAARDAKDTKKEYYALLTMLLEKNPRWQKANEKYKQALAEADEAKKAEALARGQLGEGTKNLRAQVADVRQAADAYNRDQQTLAQLAAAKKTLEERSKSLKKASSGKKKKK